MCVCVFACVCEVVKQVLATAYHFLYWTLAVNIIVAIVLNKQCKCVPLCQSVNCIVSVSVMTTTHVASYVCCRSTQNSGWLDAIATYLNIAN